jgi:hypothetical protein
MRKFVVDVDALTDECCRMHASEFGRTNSKMVRRLEKVKENRAKSKRYSRHGTASSSSSSTGSSVILFVKIVSVWPILLRI